MKSLAVPSISPWENGHRVVNATLPTSSWATWREQLRLGRSGEEKAAGLPVAIDGQLDADEEAQCALDFVEYDGSFETVDEAHRVLTGAQENARLV